MKKVLLSVFGVVTIAAFAASFIGCGGGDPDRPREITVVSREAGSGTRGAFDEIMNITDGSTNMLFAEAIIVSSTDEVASRVEVDRFAIGYTSLGSVTNRVKAVSINGVAPTEANVQNGSYNVARPFILAPRADVNNPLVADFLRFVMSPGGQAIVSRSGLIVSPDAVAEDYSPRGLNGKITLSGSTSVERVVERLREEYERLNSNNIVVEVNYNGSSAGIRDAVNRRSDIAMSSRELRPSEITGADAIAGTTFALDGIAVIVNQNSAVNDLDSDMVTRIFKGEIRYWNDVQF
jgi:phosphate transport system substrate-binding protein